VAGPQGFGFGLVWTLTSGFVLKWKGLKQNAAVLTLWLQNFEQSRQLLLSQK
jgi:hypothetical protein